jgi:hypothetical protein
VYIREASVVAIAALPGVQLLYVSGQLGVDAEPDLDIVLSAGS